MADNKKKLRNKSSLSLQTLLKRRKMSLARYIKDFCFSSHDALVAQCERMGVTPPSKVDTLEFFGEIPVANDPTDGIIVLSEPRLIDDSGDAIDDHVITHEYNGSVVVVTDERDLDIVLNNSTGEHVWPLKKKKVRSHNS